MAYFPFFVELEKKEGLIVGGGQVAFRKIEKLLPYGPHLTVVAPEIDGRIMQEKSIAKMLRAYVEDDLAGKDFVIAATGVHEINAAVARACKSRRIPVNSVDDVDNCSFLFPALARCGALSVGISTAGASPSAAVYIKEAVEELLPEHFAKILEFLQEMRTLLKVQFPGEENRSLRMELAHALFTACLKKGNVLPEAEWKKMLRMRA